MTKNGKATIDLASKVEALEKRIAVLERVCKRFTRKRRVYTGEERAAIRARLLAGQDAARKGREAKTIAKPEAIKTEKAKKANEVRPVKKSEPSASLKVPQSSSQGVVT